MTVLCGNKKLMESQNVIKAQETDGVYHELSKNINFLEEEGKTVVILAVDGIPQLVASLEEAHLAKPEAKFVVNYLKSIGMKVCLITGDNKYSALNVANHLEIDNANVHYQAYPETKKKIVQDYQKKGNRVMFIGDGINDSPVLA